MKNRSTGRPYDPYTLRRFRSQAFVPSRPVDAPLGAFLAFAFTVIVWIIVIP